MNHVVCVKWGNKYPSQYANVLYNMVKRHTTVPFEFHCITDDPIGLDAHIKTIRFPNDNSYQCNINIQRDPHVFATDINIINSKIFPINLNRMNRFNTLISTKIVAFCFSFLWSD